METLSPFCLAPVSFTLIAEEDFTLPVFKGSVLRGAFGYAFRRAVCIARQQKECKSCILSTGCAYSYIFETPRPVTATVMRKYERVPHPFILRPPDKDNRFIATGDRLDFGLILVGRAHEYLPYFILTIEELARRGLGRERGRCRLEQVTDCDGREIFRPGADQLQPARRLTGTEIINSAGPPPRRLTLNFVTPLRLVRNRQIVHGNLSFQDIFRALLRRLALLQRFHCDKAPEINFRALIEQAGTIVTTADTTRWRELRRYSTRQQKTISTSGLTGALSFAGDFTPFWPALAVGAYTNIGKNTSFGLGRFRLET